MTGHDIKLLDLLWDKGMEFAVPVYQRNYDWKKENCERLFDDIIALSKDSNRDGHFLGCIVTCEHVGYSFKNRLIIDGQQRLITVSLLLLAMCHLLDSGEIKSNKGNLADEIYQYLGDGNLGDGKNLRLALSNHDQSAYENLFRVPNAYDENSNLTKNYMLFRELILKKEIAIDDLFANIKKLIVISVELNNEDDPQLVFESLNSTGVPLTAGDKIRNFLLMDQPHQLQKQYYKDYWLQIEDAVGTHIDDFVYDYLRVKTGNFGNQKKIYGEFKEYAEDKCLKREIKSSLVDMRKYAHIYSILLGKNQVDDSGFNTNEASKLEACIFRLNRLETFVIRPFLMEVLSLAQGGKLSSQEVIEIFRTVEAYIYRRKICDKPSNKLNTVFVKLHKEIEAKKGTIGKYLDGFKVALCGKTGSAAFPEDEEFKRKFKECEIYKMTSPVRTYTLERLECNGDGANEAPNDLYGQFANGKLTIEHIMPQTLNREWKGELGKDYERVHKEWLHRIANLTLTGYNSRLSNDAFGVKRKTYKNSRFGLNQWIADQQVWGEKQLLERAEMLAEKALKIWEKPKVTIDRCVTLGDTNITFRGLGLISYAYRRNPAQKVDSWNTMFLEVVRQVIGLANLPDFMKQLNANRAANRWMNFFGDEERSKRFLRRKDPLPNLYIETNTNTETKIKILRGLFQLYNLDPNELKFVVRLSRHIT